MLSPSSQWTLTVADPSLDTPINVPFFDVVLCLQLPPTRSPGSNPPIRTKLGHTYNYKLHILLLHRSVYYTDPWYLIWHIYRKEILKTNFDTRQLYLDLPEMNWFTVTYLCLIHTCFFITTIWQILVHSEKFLWQWGSCKPCEYFLACKWKLVYNTRSDIEIFVVHFKLVDIKIEHYHCFLQSWIFKVKRLIRDCYTLCIDKFVFLPDKQWTMHITRLLLKWIIVNQKWF